MAIRGGPDIIEDGLVLHLDAAEPLCFRGEPTTNLMPYTNGVAGRVGWPGGAYTHSIETTGEFAGWEKIVATTTGSIADTVMRVGDVACTANAQYTASMEFYSPYNNLRFNVSGSHGNYIANRIGSSNKYYLNFTIPVNGNQGWWLKTISSTAANTAISNGVIYYRRAQFEQKSYYTDFTIGTRGSTVATGGGLLDLTNNGNNGTITRAASPSAGFYNANNGGSFVFDGINDWIQNDSFSITPQNNELSICLWYLTSNNANNSMLIDLCNSDTPSTNRDRFSIRQNWSTSSPVANRISCYFRNSTASFFYAYLPDQVVTNTWNHIGYTKIGNAIYGYLNGQQVASKSVSGNIATINRVIIGNDNISSNKLNGKVSLVSIYDHGLTASEVLQNYNATKGRYGL